MIYFWGKVALKADIARHRVEEKKLDERIAELEGKTDAVSLAAIRTYRHLRTQLLMSKAEVVNNVGRTKNKR
jgi:hypothetical protein